MPYRRKKKHKVKPISYASILTKKTVETVKDEEEEYVYDGPLIPPYKQRNFFKKAYPHGLSSHNTWEYAFFPHLLNLHQIFTDNLNTNTTPLISAEFFQHFSHFIYETSSQYTPPNIKLPKNLEGYYNNYEQKKSNS